MIGKKMATISSVLLLLTTLFISLIIPSASLTYKLPYNYTYVCDADRLQKLGLQATKLHYCNKALPYHVRAKLLIDMMTLSEKVQNLGNNIDGWTNIVPGVPRLGLPEYNWWSEALHGVSDVGSGSSFDGPVIRGATSFPTPITTTAAFNESLWHEIGVAVSTEARAMNNLGVAGLTFWSPNINLVRDPRWGRALETPGEDPYVAGAYSVSYVKGLQDVEGHEKTDDPNTRPLKVSACCKHYAAYDVDAWTTFGDMHVDRFTYNANATERDMVESFLKPFEMCVKDGDVSSVMCSYNKVNGLPTCADRKLLRGTIRGEWNLHGYIVSDCDSIKTLVEKQHFLDATGEEGDYFAMLGGLDLDCGGYYPRFLEQAVKKGLVKESELDEKLFNNYMVLFRLGYFDGMPQYSSLNASDVCSVKHMKLAKRAAQEGMVLLKNKNNTLPLDEKKHMHIALVGPHANVTKPMIGNYAGVPCRYITPLDGFKKYAKYIDYKVGCEDVACHEEKYIFHAMNAAAEADATVIAVGLNLTYEAEDLDRTNLDLPGYQKQLIENVAMVSKGPVIVVLFSAGGLDVKFLLNNSDVDAIVWAGYPGQEGGQAIADVVYGAYNPGGKLPLTWYPSEYLAKIPMTYQQFRPSDKHGYPGRTYRFYNGSTIFPFGYGLSYTNFTHNFTSQSYFLTKNIRNPKHCINSIPYQEDQLTSIPACQSADINNLNCKDGDVVLEVVVKNTGDRDGSDVVMVYGKHPKGIIGAPIKRLIAFRRVFLNAGESKTVRFEMNACKSLAFVTETAYEVLPHGEHTLIVGEDEKPLFVTLNRLGF